MYWVSKAKQFYHGIILIYNGYSRKEALELRWIVTAAERRSK
jgi:hypothetical protein